MIWCADFRTSTPGNCFCYLNTFVPYITGDGVLASPSLPTKDVWTTLDKLGVQFQLAYMLERLWNSIDELGKTWWTLAQRDLHQRMRIVEYRIQQLYHRARALADVRKVPVNSIMTEARPDVSPTPAFEEWYRYAISWTVTIESLLDAGDLLITDIPAEPDWFGIYLDEIKEDLPREAQRQHKHEEGDTE